MSRSTELVSLHKDKAEDARFAVCYAQGSVFKREDHFFRVEKGKRRLVLRALCVVEFFGNRCKICPNREFRLRIVAYGPDTGS